MGRRGGEGEGRERGERGRGRGEGEGRERAGRREGGIEKLLKKRKVRQ